MGKGLYVPDDPIDRFHRIGLGRNPNADLSEEEVGILKKASDARKRVVRKLLARTEPDPSDPYAEDREATVARIKPNGDRIIIRLR